MRAATAAARARRPRRPRGACASSRRISASAVRARATRSPSSALVALRPVGVPRAARLQHDHADRVRDDVVQLARDPRPLLGDGRARPLVALDDQLALARPPAPDRASGEPEPAEDREEEDRVAEEVDEACPRSRPRSSRRARPRPRGRADDRPTARGVRSDRVDGDHEADRERERVLVDRAVEVDHDPGGDVDREHRERRVAVGQQRQRQQQRERQEDAPVVVAGGRGGSRARRRPRARTAAAGLRPGAMREPPHAHERRPLSAGPHQPCERVRLVLRGRCRRPRRAPSVGRKRPRRTHAQVECTRARPRRSSPAAAAATPEENVVEIQGDEYAFVMPAIARRAAGRRCGSRTPARSRTSSRSRSSTATARAPTCSRCSRDPATQEQGPPEWVTIRAGIPTLAAGGDGVADPAARAGPLRADLLPRRPERQAALPRRDAQRGRRRGATRAQRRRSPTRR